MIKSKDKGKNKSERQALTEGTEDTEGKRKTKKMRVLSEGTEGKTVYCLKQKIKTRANAGLALRR